MKYHHLFRVGIVSRALRILKHPNEMWKKKTIIYFVRKYYIYKFMLYVSLWKSGSTCKNEIFICRKKSQNFKRRGFKWHRRQHRRLAGYTFFCVYISFLYMYINGVSLISECLNLWKRKIFPENTIRSFLKSLFFPTIKGIRSCLWCDIFILNYCIIFLQIWKWGLGTISTILIMKTLKKTV